MSMFIGAAGVTITLATIVWLLARSRDRQRRMNARLDELHLRLTAPPAAHVQPVLARDSVLDALKGNRAPGFSLPGLDGAPVTLDSLRERGKPVILFFMEPRCGPCYQLLPDIAGWQQVYGDQLTIAVISAGELATNQDLMAEYGIRQALLQHDMEVVLAYNLAQAPAAVLISPEGIIEGGPRYGVQVSRALVAEALGLEMPPAPVREIQALRRGDLAPAVHLPDLAGTLVDLRAHRGWPTLLLFWNPGCSYCAQLLPDVLAYEQLESRPQIVVISRGPYTLNRELGFNSPVVIDESRSIGNAIGVAGTPSAVIVDAGGRLATDVASGTDKVRHLLASSAMAMLTSTSIPTLPDDSQVIA
jgi:thiol-disulfide isomerase/thioredoxin